MSDKYAVIAAHRTQYPITLMCRVLSVSRAGYGNPPTLTGRQKWT